MRTQLIACIQLTALLVLTPPFLTAQAVHPGKIVRVTAPSVLLERLDAVYIGRSGDTLLFGNDERGPIRVQSSAITALDVSMGKSRARGAIRGALWGAGVMGVLGLLATADTAFDTEFDQSKGAFVATTVVVGALYGGVLGLFLPARVWKRADPQVHISAATAPMKPRHRSVTARVAFAF